MAAAAIRIKSRFPMALSQKKKTDASQVVLSNGGGPKQSRRQPLIHKTAIYYEPAPNSKMGNHLIAKLAFFPPEPVRYTDKGISSSLIDNFNLAELSWNL